MESDDNNEDPNEILLEEARRRVDHQLQRNNEIKNEAATLLRIIFSFVGVFLSVLTIVAYLVASGEVTVGFSRLIPPINRHAEMFPHFTPRQWEFMIGLVLIGSFILIGLSIRTFTILINRGFKALSPTELQTSISPEQINKLLSANAGKDTVKSAVINQLASHIRNNTNEIDSNRQEWEGSYNSYWKGVRRLLIGVFGYINLFFNGWYLVLAILILYIGLPIIWTIEQVNDEYLETISDINLYADSLSILFALLFTSGVVISTQSETSWLLILTTFSAILILPIIIWIIYTMDFQEHAGFTIRVLIAMLLTFVGYVFVYLGESFEERLSLASASNITGFLFASFLSIFIISLIMVLFRGAVILYRSRFT